MSRSCQQVKCGTPSHLWACQGAFSSLQRCSPETQQRGLSRAWAHLSATPSCRHMGCRPDSSKATTCNMAQQTVHLGGLLNSNMEGLRHAMHMLLHTVQSSVMVSAVWILVLLL